MATLAELQARRDDLAKKRASGVKAMESGERRTEYKTDAEMAAAIADLDRQIAAASGQRAAVSVVRFYSSKGC